MKELNIKHNKNIRDLGGTYKNAKIKQGMLIRGRTFLDLTPKQMKEVVDKYNIHTIIDLRSIPEVNGKPELKIPGTKYIHLPVFEESKAGITREEAKKKDKMLLYKKLPKMDVMYYEILHGESLNNLSKIVKYIVNANENEYGIYFHCSEGKDRTGILAAILLLILGLSKQEIIADYLTTNKYVRGKAFRYYLFVKYLQFNPFAAIRVGRVFLAKKQYIEVIFKVIKDEYGSNEEFFRKGLKLYDNEIEAFRKKVLL